MINNAFRSFQDYLKTSISACGGNPREVELPFNVKQTTYNKLSQFEKENNVQNGLFCFQYQSVFGSTDSLYKEYIIPGALIL